MNIIFCPNCRVNHLRDCTEHVNNLGWRKCFTCGYMEKIKDERKETKKATKEGEKRE